MNAIDKLVTITLDEGEREKASARTWNGPRNLPKPSNRKATRQAAKRARKANR